MTRRIQVLILEDRAADAELMAAELRRRDFEVDWRRVETERDFRTHLTPRLDLVLTDYNLPGFGAVEAIKTLQASGFDIPIVVSGSLGDERAAEILKLGATDYILKDRMARLGSAVDRALRDHADRVAARETVDALHRSEERFRATLGTLEDVVWSLSLRDWKITYMNPAGQKMFGRPIDDFYRDGQLWLQAVHPDDRPSMLELQQSMIRWGTGEGEMRIQRPDGTVRFVNVRAWCAYDREGTPERLEGICIDVTEKKAREEQLRHEHAALEEAQEIAHLGSWEWDVINDRVTLSREGWRIWDVPPAVGRKVGEFLSRVHEDDRSAFGAVIDRSAVEGSEYDWTVRITTNRGERWTRHRGRVDRRDPSGRPLSLKGTVEDVTDEKRAEEQKQRLEEAERDAQALREIDQFKTEFIHTMVHELNTPLTPMKLQLAILDGERKDWSDAQRRAMDIFHRNVDRLAGFVQDLLDGVRVQGGQLQLTRAPVDVSGLLSGIVKATAAQAKTAGITLGSEVPAGLAAEADGRRLEQVMTNLLSNALKFTPKGGKVTVNAHREGERVVVEVRDTGRGIAAEDLPKLFQSFSRLPGSEQAAHTGTGLGLYICKGIVEAHGGQIVCESAGPGRGTAVIFSVPTAAHAPAA